MKKSIKQILCIAGLGIAIVSCNNEEKGFENTQLLTKKDTISYAIGQNIGVNLTSSDFDSLNISALARGIKDALDSTGALFTEEESYQFIQQVMMDKEMKRKEESRKEHEGSKVANIAFLEDNKNKEGVITLESGLQYSIEKEGKGEKPSGNDVVEVHYTGKLIDGKVFDSSIERGKTIKFPVNGVIPGWTEALKLMSVGSKWKLYIPYQLAYGEDGQGPIPPYSTLLFDVELISIEKK